MLELDLLPAPHIYGGRLLWAWLLNLPDAPAVPPPLRGRWAVAVDATYLGDPAAGERLLGPLLRGAASGAGAPAPHQTPERPARRDPRQPAAAAVTVGGEREER